MRKGIKYAGISTVAIILITVLFLKMSLDEIWVSIILFIFSAFVFSFIAWITPAKLWKYAEYPIILVSFIGIIFALLELKYSRYEAKHNQQTIEIQRTLQRIISMTEYIMKEKNIWWDDVLIDNETSKRHQLGHLVMQRRDSVYIPEIFGESRTLGSLAYNLCVPAEKIDTIYWTGFCAAVVNHDKAVEKMISIVEKKPHTVKRLIDNNGLFILQILFAVTLGLQVGKVTSDLINKQ